MNQRFRLLQAIRHNVLARSPAAHEVGPATSLDWLRPSRFALGLALLILTAFPRFCWACKPS